MVIYGVALLAGCVLAGLGLGGVLGWAIGVKANVGGVGAAMLLLIWLREKLLRSALLVPATEQGFSCWNAMTGAIIAISYFLADRLTRGRLQGAPIAILLGLLLAWIGGTITGGKKGIADTEVFAGVGILGGAMLRDFAIVATAFGVRPKEIRKAGMAGVVALILGVFVSFAAGAAVACVWLSRCSQYDNHRCRRGDLHRRAGDRSGNRSNIGCACYQYRGRSD